jgi:hypothetical protein
MSIKPSLSFSNDMLLNNKIGVSINASLEEKDNRISNLSPCSHISTSSITSK